MSGSDVILGAVPPWAEVVMIAQYLHVTPSQVRAMPARDVNDVRAFLGARDRVEKRLRANGRPVA